MNWKSAAILLVVMAGLPGCAIDDQAARRRAYQAEQDQKEQQQRIEAAAKQKYAREHAFTPNKDQLAAFETTVRDQMKDPASAQFKHFRAYKDEHGALVECGMVNGKNSYGGYTGFTPYRAVITEHGGSKYMPIGAIISGVSEVFDKQFPECAG